MLKLRCLAIDDEPLALELLEDNIKHLPFLELASKCSNAMEAMKIMQQQEVDLIFLDIQMPGLTGLQFIQSMKRRPLIILVTAYEKFALDGFNLDVVDYLVKPVALERFIKACYKALDLYRINHHIPVANESTPGYFFINVDYKMLKVEFDDMVWVEGFKDYLKIHLKSSATPVVARMSMKNMEEQLPVSQFMRIHKSYILSKKAITAVKKNSVYMNTLELPVGDSYKEQVNAFVKIDLS
jgi:two-component system, LytTR family, response regulator